MTIICDLMEHQQRWPLLTISQRQRLGVEASGAPLADDGIVGPRTRGGLYASPDLLQAHSLLREGLAALLAGAREEGEGPGRNNNRGRWPGLFMGEPLLAALTVQQVAALAPADVERWRARQQGPWCAGFVSWAIRTAYGAGQPQSKGARELVRRWERAAGGERVSLEDARAGDLIAWRREAPGEAAAGHIGIVYGQARGLLLVLEGNGSRAGGAVGMYGYELGNAARRGEREPQDVLRIARRAALEVVK